MPEHSEAYEPEGSNNPNLTRTSSARRPAPLSEFVEHGTLYQLGPFATQVWRMVEEIKALVPSFVNRKTALKKKVFGCFEFEEKRKASEEYEKACILVAELTQLVADFENELRRIWQAHEAFTRGLPDLTDQAFLQADISAQLEAIIVRDHAMRRISNVLLLTHVLPVYLAIGNYITQELTHEKIFRAGDNTQPGVIWYKAGSRMQLLSEAVRILTARATIMRREASKVHSKGLRASLTLKHALQRLQTTALQVILGRDDQNQSETYQSPDLGQVSSFTQRQKKIIKQINYVVQKLRNVELPPDTAISSQLQANPHLLRNMRNEYSFNPATRFTMVKLHHLHDGILSLQTYEPLHEGLDVKWLLPFFLEIATYCRGTVLTEFDELLAGFYIDRQIKNDEAYAGFRKLLDKNPTSEREMKPETLEHVGCSSWLRSAILSKRRASKGKQVAVQTLTHKISAPILRLQLGREGFQCTATPYRFFPAGCPSIEGSATVVESTPYVMIVEKAEIAAVDEEDNISLHDVYRYYAYLLQRADVWDMTTICAGPTDAQGRLAILGRTAARSAENLTLILGQSTGNGALSNLECLTFNANPGGNIQRRTITELTEIVQQEDADPFPPYDPNLRQKILVAFNCRKKYRECLTTLMKMKVKLQNVFGANMVLHSPGTQLFDVECNWAQLSRERERGRHEWYEGELAKLPPLIKNTPFLMLREDQIDFPRIGRENKPEIEALKRATSTANPRSTSNARTLVASEQPSDLPANRNTSSQATQATLITASEPGDHYSPCSPMGVSAGGRIPAASTGSFQQSVISPTHGNTIQTGITANRPSGSNTHNSTVNQRPNQGPSDPSTTAIDRPFNGIPVPVNSSRINQRTTNVSGGASNYLSLNRMHSSGLVDSDVTGPSRQQCDNCREYLSDHELYTSQKNSDSDTQSIINWNGIIPPPPSPASIILVPYSPLRSRIPWLI